MAGKQQNRMTEPPNYITTKDLSYLQDAMSWELLAMKKCNKFAQEATNEKIKNALHESGQMHQQHYQTLLSHLSDKKSKQVH